MKLYAVDISSLEPECELPIIVYEDGNSSNRFVDGTKGVPLLWQNLAEGLFDPEEDYCLTGN